MRVMVTGVWKRTCSCTVRGGLGWVIGGPGVSGTPSGPAGPPHPGVWKCETHLADMIPRLLLAQALREEQDLSPKQRFVRRR